MAQPKDFFDTNLPTYVCQLHKSIPSGMVHKIDRLSKALNSQDLVRTLHFFFFLVAKMRTTIPSSSSFMLTIYLSLAMDHQFIHCCQI